jgi:hypothetical protein
MTLPKQPVWEPIDIKLPLIELENYGATSDWMEFDCICVDTEAPGYENIPYDFQIRTLEKSIFQCVRCGRRYRMNVTISFDLYTPLAVRYPDLRNSDPNVDLGLRDKE